MTDREHGTYRTYGANCCQRCGRQIPPGQTLCAACEEALLAQETPAAKRGGKAPVIVMTVLIVLFLAFFAAALLFGGKSTDQAGSAQPLESWSGLTDETQTSAGAESLDIALPDADEVRENIEPEPEDVSTSHTYKIVIADVTWEEARALAEEEGGYLATITTKEEYEAICAEADIAAVATSLRYLWLGASKGSSGWTGTDCWITGEAWSFEVWYPGEPSGQDEDGTEETVLCLWNVGDTGWTFNDQRNDLLSALPTVSGKIGYVIEFED